MQPISAKTKKLDIIWNITLVCPWDCTFCCTDAVHVTRKDGVVFLREQGLQSVVKVASADTQFDSTNTLGLLRHLGVNPSPFDRALADRQNRGLELTFDKKIAVLEHLLPHDIEIDFAGGDPLSCYENFLVVKHASMLFGRHNISVTSTGAGLGRHSTDEVAAVIGRFEFTFDESEQERAVNRPDSYNASNLALAKKFIRLGVVTKAQTPLHSGNVNRRSIEQLYGALSSAGVDEVLLMRTFPVGRGMNSYDSKWMMSAAETRRTIDVFRSLELQYGHPRVRLQCALKHLENLKGKTNPCDLLHESFGVNPRGQLLLSAWATGAAGDVLDEEFVLGNLSAEQIDGILSSERAERLKARLDENFGHCKIFSFLFARGISGEDALFAPADPLYKIEGTGLGESNIASNRESPET